MTDILLRKLQELLQSEFADVMFRVPGREEEHAPTKIVTYGLEPRRKPQDQQEDFPFIVVRARAGEDRDGDGDTQVEFICGAYTAESVQGGGHDLQNMIDRARRILMSHQTVGRWTIDLPVKWTVGDDEGLQAHPYYLGKIVSHWKTPQIEDQTAAPDVFGAGY
jgi:hypothetical protein